jgi:hypothetical protein
MYQAKIAKKETMPLEAGMLKLYLWVDKNIHLYKAYLSIRCLQEKETY